MPRVIASSLLDDMLSPSPTDGIRWLLFISWNDGVNVGSMRLVLHDQSVVSGGNTYLPAAFSLGLPDEDDTEQSMLKLIIQDPDLTIRRELRKLDSRFPAQVSVIPVLISDPNTSALAPFDGTLRNIRISNIRISRVSLSASVETFFNMTSEPAVVFTMARAHGFNALRG
jgi:hypothetical protein